MGRELNKDFYNKVFLESVNYSKPAEEMVYYYENWEISYNFIKENKIKNIIDLGCGPGHFPTLFESDRNINYTGIDFSDIAISQSKSKEYKKGNVIKFLVKDLSNYKPNDEDKFFTPFEFLEHISFDLDILRSLPKGSQIIFSVPSYDSEGHVRFFLNKESVEERYGNILNLNILNIKKFGKDRKIYLYHGIRK